MDPFGPDFERYKTLEGHLHDRGRIMPLFPLPPRPIRQLRKNTDMHPLVGNNLIEKLDSYCGRLCQLFRIVFPDTLDQLLIGGNRIFFSLDIDPNGLGSRFISARTRRTRILRSIHAPAQLTIKSPKRSKCFISTKAIPRNVSPMFSKSIRCWVY